MRQIKFRAWDKKLNKFDKRFPKELKDFGELGWTLTSNDFDFQQFTSLLDKNGKEIYEGDILCIPDSYIESITDEGKGPTENFSHLSQVMFMYGSYGVSVKEKGDIFGIGFHTLLELEQETGLNEIEIIGNIYENPKLLSTN